MSLAAAIEVKGWCPGALRPMQSGDGLIARVRPWCGVFTPDEARALADISETLGNGHIDLTRRANLQIRGLREQDVPALQAALRRQGLLDRDSETEAGRNIMVGPLAGLDPAESVDVRPIARELVERLASDPALHALPAKFGFLLDGGGVLSIAGERADIALLVEGTQMVVRAGREVLGTVSPGSAAALAVEAARTFVGATRVRDRATARAPQRRLGVLALGEGKFAVGVAAPFGRLEALQLRRFADICAGEIRLSPWRALYVEARDGENAAKLVDAAREIGFVVDATDPILRVDACPGAPACRSSSVDTRGLAVQLAAKAFVGSIHVSGCAKGCARSAPADLVLAGEQGRYGVIRHGTARDVAERFVTAREALDV